MGNRRERRQAELAAKKAAKKAGVAFDPAPFKIAAPPPEPDPDEFFPAHLATDPLAEFAGLGPADKYVGETGKITSHWQEHHAGCDHGFTTGNWWLLIGDDGDAVEVPSKLAAMTALRKAGATTILPVEEDPEGEENLNLPDPFAKWLGLDAEGYIFGEVGQVDQAWLEHWGYDAGEFAIGNWWAITMDHDEPVEAPDMDAAFKVVLDAGAVKIVAVEPSPDDLDGDDAIDVEASQSRHGITSGEALVSVPAAGKPSASVPQRAGTEAPMPKYFDLEVSLRSIRPRIWRRFLLPTIATFGDLHTAIQHAGGWYDGHMHAFRATIGAREDLCGTPNDDPWSGQKRRDSERMRLTQWFAEDAPDLKQKCAYLYDFGDGWELDVVLKGVVELDAHWTRKLLKGARSFPPEDSGGPWSYSGWLELLAKDRISLTDDEKDRLEWLGGWQPDDWQLAQAQATFDRKGPATRLRAVK